LWEHRLRKELTTTIAAIALFLAILIAVLAVVGR